MQRRYHSERRRRPTVGRAWATRARSKGRGKNKRGDTPAAAGKSRASRHRKRPRVHTRAEEYDVTRGPRTERGGRRHRRHRRREMLKMSAPRSASGLPPAGLPRSAPPAPPPAPTGTAPPLPLVTQRNPGPLCSLGFRRRVTGLHLPRSCSAVSPLSMCSHVHVRCSHHPRHRSIILWDMQRAPRATTRKLHC